MEPVVTRHTTNIGFARAGLLTPVVVMTAVAAIATIAATKNSIAETATTELPKTHSVVITWLDSLGRPSI